MSIDITPNSEPVGAEIRGLDLRSPIADGDLERVRGALDDHGMICMRGQQLTADQYVAFGRRLGTLRRHVFDQFLLQDHPEILVISNIVEDGRPVGVADAGQYWHTDGAFEAEPHIYSVLNAREIPHDGAGKPLGSTMFVSTAHAFATLDDQTKSLLRGRRGFHSLIAQYEMKKHTGKARHVPLTEEQKARNPDRFHPLVWPHPRSGRECLFANEGTTFGIEGMSDDESSTLIRQLCRHITRPEVVHHHRWQVGDLLIWDNYAVQHKVNFDYGPERRRMMYRMTVA